LHGNNLFASETSPYEIMPWSVGQYVLYQIISMEGEDKDNRYKISLTGEEEVNGERFFWLLLEVYESETDFRYNEITKRLRKSISFKALVFPQDTASFAANPAAFISAGIFPKDAIRLAITVEDDDQWHWVDPHDLFSREEVIKNTPYNFSPHAKDRINFSKLQIDSSAHLLNVPAGTFPCFHFFVTTGAEDEYWDEGFDLWRSADVPILGLVKMDFSNTMYWEKYINKNKSRNNSAFDLLRRLYVKRVPGRMRQDTCTVILLDYGPKK
jgi:hypothetical protein